MPYVRVRRSSLPSPALALVALALATTACSSPLEPEQVGGVYVLREVNGRPATEATVSDGVREFRMIADTVRFREDGSGTRVSIQAVRLLATGDVEFTSSRDELRLALHEHHVEARVIDQHMAIAKYEFRVWGGDLYMRELRWERVPGA
jgi:hypothetical protein